MQDHTGDEGHQDDLAGHHLDAGERVPRLATRHQIAKPGRGQGRAAEKRKSLPPGYVTSVKNGPP
jgi:hypothetical protein